MGLRDILGLGKRGQPDKGGFGGGPQHIVWATVFGVAFYLVLHGVAALGGGKLAFTDKFIHRGWTPYAAVYLAGWCVSLFFEKRRYVKRRERYLASEAYLPTDAMLDTDNDVQEAIVGIRKWAKASGDAILGPRLQRVLEHFRASGNLKEVSDMLHDETDADMASMQASYSLARVFLWAIPILGFIGTVVGVGDAVGGFAKFLVGAQEIDQIKSALVGVTDGLAVAFDSTLVALLLSVVVMVLISWIEKREQAQLQAFEDYIEMRVLRRLPVAGPKPAADTGMAEAIRDALKGLVQDSDAQKAREQALVNALSDRLAEAWQRFGAEWSAVARGTERAHSEQSARQLEAWQQIGAEAAGLRQVLEGVAPQLKVALEAGQTALGQVLAGERQAIAEVAVKQHEAAQQYVAALAGTGARLDELARLRVELEQGLLKAAGSEGIAAALADVRRALAELEPALRRFSEKPVDVAVHFTAGPPTVGR
ncbi:MAG: MotA/TolQ/ExbB proton channel family protein [candidate division WOR-3 bacterium]|nr:MotA/TolQ/ExbB proton channel family protein [candidate division WOR-3 bacterium]